MSADCLFISVTLKTISERSLHIIYTLERVNECITPASVQIEVHPWQSKISDFNR